MDFRRYVRERVPPLTLAREPEILDELAQHLSDLYHEARSDGLDHEPALSRALAALPETPADLAHEIEAASRALPGLIADRWRIPIDERSTTSRGPAAMFADFRRDFRYALRMMLHAPGLTVVVALTMALGTGATAVIFTAADALLLRSAPVADPERVVSVYTSNSDGTARFASSSYPDYVDLRDGGAFEGLAAFASIGLSFDSGGETLAAIGEVVSGNYFDVLGVRIPAGRGFVPDEDRPGNPVRVAVLAHDFWMNHFGSDRSILGASITLNGHAYTVVGITPRGFTGPVLGRAPQIWVPMAMQQEVRPPSAGVRRSLGGADLLGARGVRWMNMVGRLRPDASLEQTSSAVAVLAETMSRQYPDANSGRTFSVVRLGEGPGVRATARPLVRLLGAAVIIVLLIACANVASLLLARAVSRRREVAVRMAVGAGRSRLVRQWLTESVLLSLVGGGGGILLAIWGAPALHGLGIPESVDLNVNTRVLLFTLVVAVASGLLFGLAPVFQTFRDETLTALRDEGGAVATGVSAARLRRGFVIVQVALSLMLLVGAGLFLRTLQNAYAVDLGYRVENALLADINLDVRGYTPEAGQAFYRALLERVSAIPGVTAAGAARVPVLSGNARSTMVSTDGLPVNRNGTNGITVRVNVISEGYLAAMGIPLHRGRNFTSTDDRSMPSVAIVSRSLAARLWPQADPIGKSLVSGSATTQIVGVVPDSVYASAVERDPPPFFYVPLGQNYESGVTLHIRTTLDPLSIIPAVRKAARELDSQVIVGRPRTLADEFSNSVDEQRLMAMLVGIFGVIALLLAAVGLYGTMAHLATQRTTEVGIRLALGASRASIMLMLLGEGLRLVGIGAALGLAGALAGTRLLQSQLFGIAPTDPSTFAMVALLLTAVGLLACALPARRAMRIDPVVALRSA